MTISLKEIWRDRRRDRKRAYTKTTRFLIIVFRILYSALLIVSLFIGNLYINLLVVCIGLILILSDIKLFVARFAVWVKELKNRNFKAMKGSRVTIKTEIYNRFMFTYPVCKMYIDIDEGIVLPKEYDRMLVFGLKSFSHNIFKYALHCPYRGQYTVGADTIHVWDDLGIRYRRKRFKGKITLTVYPEIFLLRDFDDVKRKEEEQLGLMARDSTDYSDSIEIREYQEQDSMRTIHWKATSRLNKLMSKKYYATQSSRLCIFFDNSLPLFKSQSLSRFEIVDKLSEACASVCNFFVGLRIPYNFMYAQGDEIEVAYCDNEADFDGVYYLLASLPFNADNIESHSSLSEFVARADNIRSVVYIFTANITERLLYSIKELNHFGFKVAMVYVADDGLDLVMAEKAKELCHKFMTINVKDDTQESLEAF